MFERKSKAQDASVNGFEVEEAKSNLLATLEGAKDIFAMLGGMKQQAIEAGFSEEISELLVLEMVRKAKD